MKAIQSALKNVLTIGGLVMAGYVGYILVTSVPDVRRYIRISTM